MRTIIEITGVESWTKDNKFHYRTHVLLDDGSTAQGYGSEFEIGDKVESFFDEEWDIHKMRKTPIKLKETP